MPKRRHNEFGIEEIANEDLTLEDIPLPSTPWREISSFALSFDGYEHWGSFEKCADIANSRAADTLTELRTCLFFEQRRHHHFGYPPDDETMAYIRTLIEAIRDKVQSGELE